MKTRGKSARKRTRSRDTNDIGSYESQTEESDVPWRTKTPVSKAKARRKSTPSRPRVDFVSSLKEKACVLHNAVANRKTALKQIVKGVVKRLKKAEEKCLTELSNFMIQSSGSKKILSLTDVTSGDKEELEKDLTNSYDLGPNAYPLALAKGAKGKAAAKLSQRMQDFWKKLVQELGDTESLETVLSHCIEWLKSLSKSKQEALRYTSAAHAYWIVDALIEVSLSCEEEVVGKEKLLQSKKNKKSHKLSADISALQTQISSLQALMKSAFHSVFVHRYRDVKPVIRKLSLKSLGTWMKCYKDYFVRDDFLKYMGWCLNDADATVRAAVLDVIIELLDVEEEDETIVDLMGNFIERFIERFLEMVEDKDSEVVAKAVKVATLFIRHDLLKDDQGSTIPALLWDSDEKVSDAAAEFIHADTFEIDASDMKEKDKNEDDLKELVELFNDNFPQLNCDDTMENRAVAIEKMVSKLYDDLPALQDTKLLTSALLSSSTAKKKGKDAFQSWNEAQLQTLAYVLLSSIKSACGIDYDGSSKKIDEEIVEKKKTKITKIMVKEMPKLLSTFEADNTIIFPLVQIPQYLNMEDFSSGKEKTFKQMLHCMKSIYLKHVKTSIHEEVIKTLRTLSDAAHDLAEHAEHFISELATILVEQLKAHDLENTQQDEEVLESIKVGVRRLNTLLKHKDCAALIELDYRPLQKKYLTESDEEPELGFGLLELDYMKSMWKLRSEEKKSKELDAMVQGIYDNIGHMLSSADVPNTAKAKASQILSSLFVTSVSALIPEPSSGTKAIYCEFVENSLRNAAKNPETLDVQFISRAATLAAVYSFFSEIVHTLLSYYLKIGKGYDEIVKRMISGMRKQEDATIAPSAQLGALKMIYLAEKKNNENEMEEDDGDHEDLERKTARSKKTLKEIAHKFCLMHGFSGSFRNFLREGAEFAISNGADFLDAILPFAKRSTEKDLRYIYAYLVREQKKSLLEEEEDKKVDSFVQSIKKVIIQKLKKSKAAAKAMPPPKASTKKTRDKDAEDDKENQEDVNDEEMEEEEVQGSNENAGKGEEDEAAKEPKGRTSSTRAGRRSKRLRS